VTAGPGGGPARRRRATRPSARRVASARCAACARPTSGSAGVAPLGVTAPIPVAVIQAGALVRGHDPAVHLTGGHSTGLPGSDCTVIGPGSARAA
jgi:hypothetical protein